MQLKAVVMLLAISLPAGAQLVTAPTAGMTNSVDQSGAACSGSFTSGPLTLPGAVFTSSNSSAVVCYHNSYGLNANGSWDLLPEGYAGTNDGTGWMRFTFAGPVSDAGAFVNWARAAGNDAFIEALDAGNNVIDSFLITDIVTPGGTNAGEFRGISHATDDIYSLQFRGGYTVAKDIVFGSPGVTATPEPASLALLATGFVGMAGFVRRRRKSLDV